MKNKCKLLTINGWFNISKIFFSFSMWSTCLLWMISIFFIALSANFLVLSFFRIANLTFPKAPINNKIIFRTFIWKLNKFDLYDAFVLVHHILLIICTHLLQDFIPKWNPLSYICLSRAHLLRIFPFYLFILNKNKL